MKPDGIRVRAVPAMSDGDVADLAALLVAVVDAGASVGFMSPLTTKRATAFWRRVGEDVSAGRRLLHVADDANGICGTVQVVLAQPENQPHRADVAKMLVHPRARRRGIGGALMQAAEDSALAHGRTVLVLDTASDDARRLYERQGWIRVGDIPGYALLPGGSPCATTYYYRRLEAEKAPA